jgi:hypothetical protein
MDTVNVTNFMISPLTFLSTSSSLPHKKQRGSNCCQYSLSVNYHKECKCCSLWHSIQTLPWCSLFPKCHTVSQYKCKCNSIYAFPIPIFMKLKNRWYHHVDISYLEFHPDWSRYMESMDWHPYITYDCPWADFHETHACLTTLCTELLHQISWKSDTEVSSWSKVTDRWTHRHGLHIKETKLRGFIKLKRRIN